MATIQNVINKITNADISAANTVDIFSRDDVSLVDNCLALSLRFFLSFLSLIVSPFPSFGALTIM